MRNLREIIQDTRTGGRPEYEELRYAVCALEAIFTIDYTDLTDILLEGKPSIPIGRIKYQYEERFKRWERVLDTPPKQWVGWNNDPDNPCCVKRRRVASHL